MKCLLGLVMVFYFWDVIFAAPSKLGYQYDVQKSKNQYTPDNSLSNVKNPTGYEIIKLDCQQNGPIVKEADGKTVTITYYDCGEKGQQIPNKSKRGYLSQRKTVFHRI